MLELSHLQFHKKDQHLFSDVSFILGKNDFTSIQCHHEESDELLAYYLSGLRKIENGTLSFNKALINETISYDEYRKNICCGLIEDFLVFEEASVEENITLLYEVNESKLRKVLFDLKLLDVRNQQVQTLSFALRIRVVIARIIYYGYPITLFYPKSTKYALKERKIIYEQFKQYYPYQFIVIGDEACKDYATRMIELDEGYLISDSKINTQVVDSECNHNFGLSKKAYEQISKKLNKHYWLFYRCLFIMIILLMTVCSILVNTTTLHVNNIKTGMVNQDGYVEIEKYLVDNEHQVYKNYRVPFIESDIQLLNERLSNTITCDYNAIDSKYALAYLEGYYGRKNEIFPVSSIYDVSEIIDDSLQASLLVGTLPQNYGEVILCHNAAQMIMGKMLSASELLGKSFYWYGDKLTISGILENNKTYMQRLFVLKGYMDQHLLANMHVFPIAEKEIVLNNEIKKIEELQKDERLYYYLDHSGIKYQHNLNEQSVVLSYEMAKSLGFQDDYEIDNYMEYLNLIEQYQTFVNQYIGQTLTLNAYQKEEVKFATLLLQDEFEIAGFVPPSYDEALNKVSYSGKVVYLAKKYLQPYNQKNIRISKVYYVSQNNNESKNDIEILMQYPYYDLLFSRSPYLDLLIVDFKELTSFFVVLLITFAILTYMLYYMLMKKTLRNSRKEMSLYYRLGESKKSLVTIYKEHYLNKISKYLKVATIIGLMIQFIYLFLVITILNGSWYYFIFMLLPIIIALLFYGGFMMIAKWLLTDSMIFLEVYGGMDDE